MRRLIILLIALKMAGFSTATAALVPISSVQGFPNERTSDDPPQNAIDGSLSTFTWTTEAFNSAQPSYLAVGFSSTKVNRIRLWKDKFGGGGPDIKNLTIQFTTDDGFPLSSRNWQNVAGLTSGYRNTELFHATSVNTDGTVVGDIHTSTNGDGFGSLTFDTVQATGIRICFSNPGQGFNHYRVGEFQVHDTKPHLTIEVSPVRLCWDSNSNSTYQIQYRSELTTNEWADLGVPIAGNRTTNCITDAIVTPQRFYRVVVLP
jgi:hypothetical protein